MHSHILIVLRKEEKANQGSGSVKPMSAEVANLLANTPSLFKGILITLRGKPGGWRCVMHCGCFLRTINNDLWIHFKNIGGESEMEVQSVVFNVHEVAQYLSLPVSKVYELCQKRKLGAKKFGKNWRIPKKAIDALLEDPRKLII